MNTSALNAEWINTSALNAEWQDTFGAACWR
jgi:hypothetical protein